ncbi:retinol-binding protein 4-like [Mizuhopecten yessoensis]|uniref:retinol-binding protein 4-like n=1 Tax=Mizuhopecten yessoensis TaxID=6573 RepID=UPI000B45F5E3|nr:retinol-binding protein 4-like [Mizuhopecten yessoensis]
MDIPSLILTCFCLSLSVYFSYCQSNQNCNIDKFEVQKDFNESAFEGYWYVISANRQFNPFQVAMSNSNGGGMNSGFMGAGSGMFSGFNVGMPRQMPLAMQRQLRNLRYYFEMTSENGTMFTLASGTVMGNRCFYAHGVNNPPNVSIPAKTDYSFQGSLFPIWVISTDYVGYAVIYSCWDTNVNGECSDNSAHVLTLNRVMEGHTPAELAKVEETSTYVCVPPTSLRSVLHNGGCAFNASYFPLDEFSIMNDINYFPVG